jgi:phage shock protein C
MQRIIQINIVGRVIPIEEDAYQILKNYIASIERQFMREVGKDEIIQDIETRIAELFFIRLNAGAPAIDKADVNKVIDTLGAANEINDNASSNNTRSQFNTASMNNQQYQYESARRLYRNPNDKVIGGVCSGVANYFDIDPVIVRLVFAVLFLTAGIGLVAYIIAWAIIPVAKTPADLGFMSTGKPMDFHTMSQNMAGELQDLKKRGEEMSRELKDFFSKKK